MNHSELVDYLNRRIDAVDADQDEQEDVRNGRRQELERLRGLLLGRVQ